MKDRGSHRTARRHDEDGAAAIEFAIVASLLFMLVFGIIDFGFGFHTWNGTAHAAREGARYAAVESRESEIVARTRAAADFLDQSKMSVTVTCSSGGSVFGTCVAPAEGDYIRVTVDYVYSYITPLPGFAGVGDDMTLHSQSEVRYEGA